MDAEEQRKLDAANLTTAAEMAAAKVTAAAAEAAEITAKQLEASTKAAIAKIQAAATAIPAVPATPSVVVSTEDMAASLISKINETVDAAIAKAATLQPPLPPKTTLQEDIEYANKRRINLIWEYTQAFIALTVVVANVIVGGVFGVYRIPSGEYPAVLSSSLFLVTGFYFSRQERATTLPGPLGRTLREEGDQA